MTLPDLHQIHAVIDATWPAATKTTLGPWTIRKGAGGGSRVSATTAISPPQEMDIAQAETAMRALGQVPIFMIRAGDDPLDAWLGARGYARKDPTNLYVADVGDVAANGPTPDPIWPPTDAQIAIWAQGGVGAPRLAVMARADLPKTTLVTEWENQAAGTVFVARHGDCAMVHALEVAASFRRRGLARHLMQAAAGWAQDMGARYIALPTTQANFGANALYASLGMTHVGQYHYRSLPE